MLSSEVDQWGRYFLSPAMFRSLARGVQLNSRDLLLAYLNNSPPGGRNFPMGAFPGDGCSANGRSYCCRNIEETSLKRIVDDCFPLWEETGLTVYSIQIWPWIFLSSGYCRMWPESPGYWGILGDCAAVCCLFVSRHWIMEKKQRNSNVSMIAIFLPVPSASSCIHIWFVVWNMCFDILGILISTDFHIFRGVESTNQIPSGNQTSLAENTQHIYT